MRSLALLFPVLCLASAVGAAPLTLHVARDGNDAAPTGPFATLTRARDAIRSAKAHGGLPPEGAVVTVHAGTYPLSDSLVLTAEDSGTAAAPIRWIAAPGESVVLSGGRIIDDFRPVTDPALLARLPIATRARVVVTDLRAAGVADFGKIEQRGSPGLELFYRGKRQPLARYPNEGWLLIADVPQTGAKRFIEGLEREKRFDGVPVGRHYGRFTYSGDRPAAWSAANEIYVHGFWTWDWSDSFQRVQSIDPKTRELTLAEPHHHYGYTKNQRYRFLNVLEELDEPGEWYLDRAAGRAYFCPPEPLRPGDVTVSMLAAPLMLLEQTAWISVEGFAFEAGRGSGVVVKGGEHCQIAGCTFRLLGGEAVLLDGGRAHRLTSCDLFDLANGAVRVVGGDRATLTPGGHEVVNNHIHHYSQWLRTGQYAALIDGVGQRIAHNLIHDAPFEAMYLRGNDHVVELNEVHHVCQETGDAGGIHTGRDFTWQGNIIRDNYWHDLRGPGLHGVTAVYLDDFSSGFTITGNVFYRAGRAVQIGGGRDNTVENNLMVECDPAIHLDARGLGWASNYFNGEFTWLVDRFREMHADQPPYTTRYPKLKTLLQDEPPVPKGNRVVHNISWGSGRWCDVYDFYAFDFSAAITMRDNWVADAGFMRRRAQPEKAWDPYYLNIDMVEGYTLLRSHDEATRREFAGNVITDEPPGTFDPRTIRFTPSDPARVQQLGFRPLAVDKMGLQRDAWRQRGRADEP